MTPPTPAAVRAAIKNIDRTEPMTDEEVTAWGKEPRWGVEVLHDQIRAIAAEMRKESDEWYAASLRHGGNKAMTDHANDLEKFADKLEGRDP